MDDGFRNELEIVLVATRRSGHHAVAVWLAHQVEQPICFLNLIRPKGDPFTERRDPFDFERSIDRFMPLGDVEATRASHKNCLMLDYQDAPLDLLGNPELIIPNREQNPSR